MLNKAISFVVRLKGGTTENKHILVDVKLPGDQCVIPLVIEALSVT